MTSKTGTGEKLGEIEINDELTIEIEDDGDDDCWVRVNFVSPNRPGTLSSNLSLDVRKDIGDEKLMEDLDNLEGDNYTSLL
jgi:hypothetical protein